jgi:hypothetical protein
VLNHDYGIRSGWNGSACHDLHAFTGSHNAIEATACFDLPDASQRSAWNRIF